MLPSRVWRDLFKKRPSAPLSRAGRCELDVLPIYMITTTILQGKITQASLIKRASPINRIGSGSVNKALKVGSVLHRHQLVNQKNKRKKRKSNPTKDKNGNQPSGAVFFLFDGLFLSGELIIGSVISLRTETSAGSAQQCLQTQ